MPTGQGLKLASDLLMEANRVFTNGGDNLPAGPPPGMPKEFVPLDYINQWDPALVDTVPGNITYAGTLGIEELKVEPVKAGKMIIVGSGPSMVNYLDKIRELRADKKNALFVVNNAHPYLIKQGIAPQGALIFEIMKRAYDCLERPHPDCTYYICSICDPYAFDQLRDNKCLVWHCASEVWSHIKALGDAFGKIDDQGKLMPPMLVGGGFTTFLRTLSVGYVLGYRDYELFGFESSFEGEHSHFFGTPDYGGPVTECYAVVQQPTPDNPKGVRRFMSKAYLIRQADEFRKHCEQVGSTVKMRVHGDGLLPAIHRHLFPQFYEE